MKSDVVICTAQVLINAIRKKDISIEDISLLILDECHHTGILSETRQDFSVIIRPAQQSIFCSFWFVLANNKRVTDGRTNRENTCN